MKKFGKKNVLRYFSFSKRNLMYDESKWEKLDEGSATILFPKGKRDSIFYNAVQEVNRDLSIAAIQTYVNELRNGKEDKEGIKVLEALSASGKKISSFFLLIS